MQLKKITLKKSRSDDFKFLCNGFAELSLCIRTCFSDRKPRLKEIVIITQGTK